jgi:chromosome segregation ATPase
MNDSLADDFMAPVRAREQRLAQLDALISERERELTTIQHEIGIARKAMNDLGAERVAYQSAVNAAKVELVRTQNALAEAKGAYDELKKKVAALPTMRRAG